MATAISQLDSKYVFYVWVVAIHGSLLHLVIQSEIIKKGSFSARNVTRPRVVVVAKKITNKIKWFC